MILAKIWAKWESGLTGVQFNWDPPVEIYVVNKPFISMFCKPCISAYCNLAVIFKWPVLKSGMKFQISLQIIFSHKQHIGQGRVVPGGAQTHTSCSLGKCPNHLDHQQYMLPLVFKSPLRAYWSDHQGPWPWMHCHLQWLLFSVSAHLSMHLSEDICASVYASVRWHTIIVPKYSQLFHCIINNIFSQTTHRARKRVALGGAQTHISCSLGKHPNHLDHQNYMLPLVFKEVQMVSAPAQTARGVGWSPTQCYSFTCSMGCLQGNIIYDTMKQLRIFN